MTATQAANNLAALIVERLGSTETLKLQKLLYYCNAWSLAIRNRPMFTDATQAWQHGPVVASIYAQHRMLTSVDTWEFGDASQMSADDVAFADAVIDLYGARSGWALRNLTHSETPWIDAWKRCKQGAIKYEVITQDEISAYFKQTIEKARAE